MKGQSGSKQVEKHVKDAARHHVHIRSDVDRGSESGREPTVADIGHLTSQYLAVHNVPVYHTMSHFMQNHTIIPYILHSS